SDMTPPSLRGGCHEVQQTFEFFPTGIGRDLKLAAILVVFPRHSRQLFLKPGDFAELLGAFAFESSDLFLDLLDALLSFRDGFRLVLAFGLLVAGGFILVS